MLGQERSGIALGAPELSSSSRNFISPLQVVSFGCRSPWNWVAPLLLSTILPQFRRVPTRNRLKLREDRRRTEHDPTAFKEADMPMPSKGTRRRVESRVPDQVGKILLEMQERHGMSESQLIADLLCIALGRPNEARELNQGVLDLPMTA